MYKRALEKILKRFAEIYPIVGITGPRQSGKTTLAKELFPHLKYVSLENLDLRSQAKGDPVAFLSELPGGAILDEVQHVPELLSFLQGIVDEEDEVGKWVITGSQNFSLSQSISQSLSGRVGMATLLPLAFSEMAQSDPWEAIFLGGYPRLHRFEMEPQEFFPGYVDTYVERDVRQIQNIGDFSKFHKFLRLCASRVGQLVNFSSIAVDCGISHETARRWLSILQASYVCFTLNPYYRNFSKRLIKSPKLYFYDTGLASHLLGIEKETQLRSSPFNGALFENLIVLELLKGRLNRGKAPNIYFWRDRGGHEVDCVADWGGVLQAFEMKSSSTYSPKMLAALNTFLSFAPEGSRGSLIYAGDQKGSVKGVELVPLEQLENLLL